MMCMVCLICMTLPVCLICMTLPDDDWLARRDDGSTHEKLLTP